MVGTNAAERLSRPEGGVLPAHRVHQSTAQPESGRLSSDWPAGEIRTEMVAYEQGRGGRGGPLRLGPRNGSVLSSLMLRHTACHERCTLPEGRQYVAAPIRPDQTWRAGYLRKEGTAGHALPHMKQQQLRRTHVATQETGMLP